jgi:hypothetical protein
MTGRVGAEQFGLLTEARRAAGMTRTPAPVTKAIDDL